MSTRSLDATGLVPAAGEATTRSLRPRQAPASRGPSTGVTIPRVGGRVTRSSAQLSHTDPVDNDHTVTQPSSSRTSRRSHKRSRVPGATTTSHRAKRARRSRQSPVFYGEDSDSGDEPDNPYMTPGSEVEHQKTSTPRRRTTTPKATPKKSTAARTPKTRPGHLVVCKGSSNFPETIPNWTTLPYLILVQIFRYAVTPLTDLQQARWLTAASGVCRAFVEPALTVLYESPPLLSRSMAHGLVALLSQDPSSTLFNYRVKVEELWIDVEEIASKTYKGQLLDLVPLVGTLPRLRTIQFFHSKDDPPYRSLDGNLRWHYPAALFDALNGVGSDAEMTGSINHARLSEWQWNRRLMGPDLDLAGIQSLHQSPAFQSLRRLSFVNFQVPSLHAKATVTNDELIAQDMSFIQSTADAIKAVPALEHLSFESSTVVNDQLLPLLPKTLQTLELTNCWDVNGEDFASYLLSSGRRLKHIILRHNQSLNLSFVTVLGEACPNLQVLSMDFKTYNHHEFYHDSDPSYDEVLLPEQVPHWPESLETLQLLNMKKWSAEAAETLIQSLLDSAPKLLKLRRLDLKAMLSIPIQERSQLRNKWEAKLKRVFLRHSEDPAPLSSLRRRPAQRDNAVDGKDADGSTTPVAKDRKRKLHAAMTPENPSRRSTRLAVQWSNPSSRASSILGRDLRGGRGRPSYAEQDTDTDADEGDSEVEGDGDDDGGEQEGKMKEKKKEGKQGSLLPDSPTASTPAFFRHGMCEKVEMLLDNQKTAETTLTMDDFLDSERDDLSDDDWVGEDEDFDTGYAW